MFAGNKTQHSQVGYIGHRCAVYFDNKLRKLKLQSIRPAKAREKPPYNVEKRIMGCGERKYPSLAENAAQESR